MPTTRPRTQVTHTRAVEQALEIARSRWPDESPSALLMHLVVRGGQATQDEQSQREIDRRAAVDAAASLVAALVDLDMVVAHHLAQARVTPIPGLVLCSCGRTVIVVYLAT